MASCHCLDRAHDLDHQYSDGPPLIFETMVFGIADYEPHWRYSTEEEAKLGHQRVVELLRSGVQDGLGVADRLSK